MGAPIETSVRSNTVPTFSQLITRIDQAYQEKLRTVKASKTVSNKLRRMAVLDILLIRFANLEHATSGVQKRPVSDKDLQHLAKQANELLEELAAV